VEAWSEQLIAKCGKQVVKVGPKSLNLTCTVGLSVITPSGANLDATIDDAIEAARKGRGRGGNQAVTSDKADNDARVKSYDTVWVKHIKAALMENRFRLVQQPVASLQGDDLGMFDVLVRMIDGAGKEVLPAEFMAAAERNDLLKNIDRWVVGASLSFAAQRKPGCLFVRMSKDTVRDGSFLDWLDNHIRASRAEPGRLCFQIPEAVAAAVAAGIRLSPRTRRTTMRACSRMTRCGSSTSRLRSWRIASGSYSSLLRACRAMTRACSTFSCA
jgi:predicted signal transduction protein with EAL and GGDEF domain